MNQLKYVTACINIDLTINKLLFRYKKTDNEEQKEGILQQVKDLDYVKSALNDLKTENEELMRLITDIHIKNLNYEQEQKQNKESESLHSEEL